MSESQGVIVPLRRYTPYSKCRLSSMFRSWSWVHFQRWRRIFPVASTLVLGVWDVHDKISCCGAFRSWSYTAPYIIFGDKQSTVRHTKILRKQINGFLSCVQRSPLNGDAQKGRQSLLNSTQPNNHLEKFTAAPNADNDGPTPQ